MARSDKNSERAHQLADDLTGHLLRSGTEPAALAAPSVVHGTRSRSAARPHQILGRLALAAARTVMDEVLDPCA